MKIKTEKIFGPGRNFIDPAYWEPDFPLFFGGEGGDSGGSGGNPTGSAGDFGSEESGQGGFGGEGGGGSLSSDNTGVGPSYGGSEYGGEPGGYGGGVETDNRRPPVITEGTGATVNPLQDFLDALGQYNQSFLDAEFQSLSPDVVSGVNEINTGILQQLGAIDTNVTPQGLSQAQQRSASLAGYLQNIGQGSADPRFEAYRRSRLNLLNDQRQAELGRISEQLSRRGLGGSAAELNASSATENRYNKRADDLTAQLGLENLGRQDAALLNALGAYAQSGNLGLAGSQQRLRQQQLQSALLGQQAGLNQQNLSNVLTQIQSANQAQEAQLQARTAGLQNLTLPYALETARTAAQNLGENPEEKGLFGGEGFLGLF